jgi:long-chain fatty acid transport protein
MSQINRITVCNFAVLAVVSLSQAMNTNQAFAQAFGVELQGSVLPASGGMGGTGIARPQDVQTPLALNPATLSQFKGTQFNFSGAWVVPTINLENNANLPLADIQPFAAKSQRPGSIVGNIGVSQDLTAYGIRGTVGMGLLTASGLGVNYNQEIASNGTFAEMVVLQTAVAAGLELTDRLSFGVQGLVGSATMDGIFAAVSSSTPAYDIRGVDLFVGGAFRATQQFGLSSGSVESYWVGFGTTWRFGRGGCQHVCATNHCSQP